MIQHRIATITLILLSWSGLSGQAPYFQLRDLDNTIQSYEDLKGEELTVIDFWATWCQPCLRSMPELNELYHEYEERGVNFIGISIDGTRNQSKLKPFIHSLGIEYTILRDVNSEVMTDLNVYSVPTLLIVDKKGEVVFIHEGFRPGDKSYIQEKIEEHL